MNTSGQQSQQQQQQQQKQQQKQAGGYHISSPATEKSKSHKRHRGPATPHPLQNQAQLQKIMSLFQ